MAKDKKSFLLYCDLIHTVKELPDEKAGQLLKHILQYVNDEDPQTDDLIIKISFEPIKQQLKRDLKKYEGIRERNSANARKRWDAKNATASDRIPNSTKNADSVTDTVTDTVNDIKQTKGAFFQNEELNDCFSRWLQMCQEKRKEYSQSSIEAIQMKLSRLPDATAIAQVNQSLEKGWKTLHALDRTADEPSDEDEKAGAIMREIKRQAINETLYGTEPQIKKLK